MKAIVLRGANALPGAYSLDNNRGGWGVLCELASATYLGDRARFDRAVWRWRDIMNESVRNNILIHEVYRESDGQGNGTTGLHYCNFFMDAMVQAAEIARFGGVWLYDHVTPDGSTLRDVWELVSRWTAHPGTYPFNTSGVPSTTNRIRAYVHILNALWPNTHSASLLATHRVTEDFYGFRRGILAYQGRPLAG